MEQKITSFYRLTEREKKQMVEQCMREIEARKIRETETVRKILEELLEEKWNVKKKNAESEMRVLLDELTRQVNEAQSNERKNNDYLTNSAKRLAESEARNESREKQLKDSEARCLSLQKKLTKSEKRVDELTEQLAEANDISTMVMETCNESAETIKSMKKENSDNEAKIGVLEEELKRKSADSDSFSSEAQRLRREKRLLERDKKKLTEQKVVARRLSFIAGVAITAAVFVMIFPTRTASYQRLLKSGVTEIYNGGANMFDNLSGFGKVVGDDGIEYAGFWANDLLIYSTEFVLEDGSTYSGSMNGVNRPLGFGIYTRKNGGQSYGIWTWATEKTVKVSGVSDTDGAEETEEKEGTEYTYTGLLRFGKPYGYGTFESTDDGSIFVGEFYDGIFENGTWIMPDGSRKDFTVK